MQENIWIDDSPGVPQSVMKDMRQRLGHEANETDPDEEILNMSGYEFLNEYLNWNGLIGYADMIVEAIYMAYGINLEDYPFDRDIKRNVEVW